MWVSPTEEEIFQVHCLLTCSLHWINPLTLIQRYSPDLQKKALAGREQRQKDFDAFVGQLKEASKSDKPSKFTHCLGDVLDNSKY